MSEVTDAMAAAGETEAAFGTTVFDYVHRARWAAADLWFEAIRTGMSEAVITARRSALYRAEGNRREYVGLMRATVDA